MHRAKKSPVNNYLSLFLENPKYLYWALGAFIGFVGLLTLFFRGSGPQEIKLNTNSLAIGTRAKTRGAKGLAFVRPAGLNGQSRDQIYDLRKQVVSSHADLITGSYEPYGPVFDRIEDGLPWFSTLGYFVYGPGPASIIGNESEEGRYLMNPFLLVGPEFWGLSAWHSKGLKWDQSKVTASLLAQRDFPLYPKPDSLIWYPDQSRAEVSYDLTSYIESVNRYSTQPLTISDINFGTVAYNARDMNLKYIYYSKDKSSGIVNPKDTGRPVRVLDRLERNEICKIDGGCNHISGGASELDHIQVQGLPAIATILLWQNQPSDPEQVPDMTWVINLR